ncbi:MAG: AbrB/MazE/SpoVT family DNA-binding domain-containing protein [Bacilli bacterium]|nr:AbrB/MazE/SpoVT family DNA-binding domain-containing protein [Bacilli bacterium]
MKSTGITRRIDDLGRIVIPKEIRKNLKIKENEVLEIFINNDEIILKKFSPFNDSEKVLSDYIKVINDMTGNDVIITDRDKVILSSKRLEEKLLNKKLSEYVNDLIENRSIFLSNDMKGIEVIDNEKIKQNYYFIPFIIDSDVVGSIIMFSSKEFDENSKSLLLIASKLLVNYIE